VFSYVAYGLSIHSDLVLPGLVTGRGNPDAVVRFGNIDPAFAPDNVPGNSVRAFARSVYLNWEGAGQFLIREGCEVTIKPHPGVEEGVLRALLLGPALAVLLQQRGYLVLHGSAIVLDEAVVAFLGCKGAGKSTMAAALHVRGHGVMADDVIAVRTTTSTPNIFPAYPQLNLWPDTAASLGYGLGALPRLHPRIEKRALPAALQFPGDPVPLRRIYVLAEGPDNAVKHLRSQNVVVELLRHSYGIRLLTGQAVSNHFRQCVALSRVVSIRQLNVRPNLSELPRLARLVEDDII
jgi:hypothetical protein